MMEAEDFIKKFHNLEGTLLKEKKKSFFCLLDSHKSLINKENVLKEIAEKLTPKTYLEESYKLDLLIFFKRNYELFEMLKSGNDIAASKIIRQPWFVPTLFQNVTPKDFVQNVFPYLSIIVRSKILKQIVKHFKDEVYINSLFDILLETYGLKPGLILLSGCSINKIQEILINYSVDLSVPQLKLLHDKEPTLIDFYYGELHKRSGNTRRLKPFSIYLSRNDPSLYVKLLLKYGFYGHRIGRQATRKFVAEYRDDVIQNAQKYLELKVFNEEALVAEMGDDFKLFLKEGFPKKLTDLKYSPVHVLLQYYPKKKRYELYSNTFNQVYGRNLLSSREYITEELLEAIPNYEEREEWVEILENDVKYLKYKRSTLAVPELKEKLIRCDNIAFREDLLRYIVATCGISKDYNSLLDVLNFLCTRFRNTDGSVFTAVLQEIQEKIDLEELNTEHWRCIHEIILIQDVRKIAIHGHTVFEYCRFLYKTGNSFEQMIPMFMKSYNFSLRILKFKTKKFKDERFHRDFLEFVLKHYCEDFISYLNLTCEIVLGIKLWNKRHPDNEIFLFKKEAIIKNMIKCIDQSWVYYKSDEMKSMNYLICRGNIVEPFVDIYFNRMNILENVTLIRWLLKYKPHILEVKIDKIVDITPKKDLMNFMKKHEHTGLVKKLIEYYKEKLKHSKEGKEDKIAQLLASIMPKEDYLKLLETLVPHIGILDLVTASEEDKLKLQIQSALAKSVRYSTCHAEALPILIKYCRGDTIQSALHSLYSCFNHTPENNLKPILEILLEKQVSLRKHAIFLAAMAFPIVANNELGQRIMDDEENSSVQKHLFSSLFKYLRKNPVDEIWNVVHKYMEHVTIHDNETLILLTDISIVPESFRAEYAERVWEVFEYLEIREKRPMKKYYGKFIENLKDEDMKYLSHYLCMKIMSTKYFEEFFQKNDTCMNFAIKFMIYGSEMRKNIKIIIGILVNYRDKYLNDSKQSRYVKSVIYKFCTKVFHKIMNEKKHDAYAKFSTIFLNEWENSFTTIDTFEEYLMLHFMVIKHEEDEDTIVYTQSLREVFDRINEELEYSGFIVDLFKNFFSSSLIFLLGENNYDLKYIKVLSNFLKASNYSVICCVLVIQLLPIECNEGECKNWYNNIIASLQNNSSDIVQLYLNRYFKTATYV